MLQRLKIEKLSGKFILLFFLSLFTMHVSRAAVELRVDSKAGSAGSQVSVPVRAFHFDSIVGMQGSIQFDSSVLAFDTILGFGLPSMGIGNFGIVQAANGKLTYSWDDASLAGVSLADSTVIFEIAFTIIGASAQSSSVCFSGSPTPQEVVELQNNNLVVQMNVGYTCGNVQVAGGAPFISVDLTHVTCAGANDGTIALSVSGGSPPYTYAWSFGDTTETITNLVAGTYLVVVMDAQGWMDTAIIAITEPDSLVAVVGTGDASCFGEEDGTVSLAVTGGTAPYSFSWSTGALTDRVNDLAAGTYTVTVSDSLNCSTVASGTINQPAAITVEDTVMDVSIFVESDWIIDINVFGGRDTFYSYQWTGGITTEDLTNVAAGTYTVTVTDGNGCSGTTTVTIEPVSTGPVIESEELTLSPNPNTGNFIISLEGKSMKTASMQIQNALGQIMFSGHPGIYGQQIRFSAPEFTAGVYFLKLVVDDRVYLKRFLVRK